MEIAPTVSVKATAGLGLARGSQLSVEAPPAVKDVVGASLIGATYNTVTVAERFTLPASVVSSNAAAKAKNDFVVGGITGLAATGLVVDDLKVYGYGTEDQKDLTAKDLLAGGLVDRDAQDEGDDKHEAVYFRRGIDAIDNTIRFLRGVELRAEDYRVARWGLQHLRTDALARRLHRLVPVQSDRGHHAAGGGQGRHAFHQQPTGGDDPVRQLPIHQADQVLHRRARR